MRLAAVVGLILVAGIDGSAKALPPSLADPHRLAPLTRRLPSLHNFFTAGQTQSSVVDVWAPLKFLLGRWQGPSKGQPGNGTVNREYKLVLRERFIEVRNASTYRPQPQNPKGETHEDVGYISYDQNRKAFVLRQFHVEGFVNTYLAESVRTTEVVFTSEAIEKHPLRLACS